MALPQAVARKAERAAELIKAQQPQPATPTQSAPAAVDDAAQLKQKLEAQMAANEKLTQQHKSLRGMYDSQIPQMQQENKELKAKLKELDEKLDAKTKTDYALTDDEKRLLGEETVPIVVKLAAGVVEEQVKKHLKPLAERVDHFQRMSEAQYWAVVDQFVPDFDAQNDDPKFVAWLKEVDPTTGQLRDDLLQRAHAALQGYRVAEIFRSYKEGRDIGARAATPQTPAIPPEHINPGPGSGNPPPPEQAGGKKQWTRVEITAFYDTLRRTRARMTKEQVAEARKTEVDISNASKEGRIIG